MNSTAHPSRINPPGRRRTGALILKGGAYQASSLCLYGTDTTYPWKALLKPCGDLQGQPSCHMWLAQVPVHDSSGRRGATSTLPAQQGAMPSAGASRGIFQGLPYLLKTQLVSVVSKQPSASPEPASFEQRDPRAEAVPMGRVSPIYVLTRREGRRGAWQRTREGSAVSAHPGGHTHTGIQRATPSQRRPPALKLRVCGVWGGWWRRECAVPAISCAMQYAISAT